MLILGEIRLRLLHHGSAEICAPHLVQQRVRLIITTDNKKLRTEMLHEQDRGV